MCVYVCVHIKGRWRNYYSLMCCCLVGKSRLTLCDPVDCSTPGVPVSHHLLESAQVQVFYYVPNLEFRSWHDIDSAFFWSVLELRKEWILLDTHKKNKPKENIYFFLQDFFFPLKKCFREILESKILGLKFFQHFPLELFLNIWYHSLSF